MSIKNINNTSSDQLIEIFQNTLFEQESVLMTKNSTHSKIAVEGDDDDQVCIIDDFVSKCLLSELHYAVERADFSFTDLTGNTCYITQEIYQAALKNLWYSGTICGMSKYTVKESVYTFDQKTALLEAKRGVTYKSSSGNPFPIFPQVECITISKKS